ncbi:class I SAM-dependent methyltransferase [Methylocystis heyeri]|uniref:Methyltransferase domain-containing protein n=1 Tax=Methylocystis heyeri TaxID=391905 RepID=A0A6B8KE37_9HYPH|nr:methyltransferase domain-containing protein [Methylocystis heyeri]QGM45265.1 methyltransferase domain-containing protein [Methylocystis heyeri]
MTQSPPIIFDRALVRKRLARALEKGAPDFLMQRAAEDLQDRLFAIRREFPRALDLATPTAHFAQVLAARAQAAPLRAAATFPSAAETGVRVAADEEALPFAPQSLDLVVSGMALQWVNDLPGVFAQVRRSLAPDGLFLACMAGGSSLTELRQALAQAEAEILGGASPRVSPFVEVRDLGSLLQRAGFALPVTDADVFTLRYDSMFALCRDLRAMGAANALAAGSRRPLRRSVFLRAAQIYAEKFSDTDGRVRASFEIIWLSGWAPHESQQKPLKPGSAQMRLADALKATSEKS